jgi:hypothetical protein
LTNDPRSRAVLIESEPQARFLENGVQGAAVVRSWAFSPQATARRVNGYAAARGITGSFLIALNFFVISTCSYFLPIPGVLCPVIASEIRSGTSRSSSCDFR